MHWEKTREPMGKRDGLEVAMTLSTRSLPQIAGGEA
jgi:hypothetical protein